MSYSLVINFTLFIFFLLFTFNRLKRNYKVFYLLFLFYLQGFNTITSLMYIEEGIYINEQGRDSYFVGAVFFYLLFFVLTIFLCEKTISYLDKHVKIPNIEFRFFGTNISNRFVFGLVIFVLFLLYLNVYISPSPMFDDDVTRFTYWEKSKLRFLNSIFGNTSIFIPFALGVTFKKNKKASIFFLVLYFLNMILIGQKFSPIISGFYAFFFPIILTSNRTKPISIRKLFNIKVIAIFVCLFSLVYYKYSLLNPFKHLGVDTPFKAIVYRAFGLQAHLFWGCVENFIISGMNKSWNILDLNFGMHHLMRHFYPGNEEQLEGAIQAGYSFTNAYPAILFYVFPAPIAYILHSVFMVFILAPLIWLLKRLIKGGNVIFALIAFQLFSWVIYAFKMGYFHKLLIPIVFFLFFSMILYLIKTIKVEKNSKSSS